MTQPSFESRIQGAIMGAFVGDALGVGPHWYYDLNELKAAYGPWIDGYTTPKPGRYHEGLKAGDSSQAGIILTLTLQSLVAEQGYNSKDFCRRLDQQLFPYLNGNAMFGPGGFTSHSMRDTWRARQQGKAWGCIASSADNTEAAERILAIAALYAKHPKALSDHVCANIALTQKDPIVQAMTLAYALVLGQLLQGETLDSALSGKLMALSQAQQLPYHRTVSDNMQPPQGQDQNIALGHFASPDALLTVSSIAQAIELGVNIEPAWQIGLLYGLPCAVFHQLPAVYHLAARFQDDFEAAVLNAINGGGQNLARAMLTGALCGAIGGLEAIPQRFIEGLSEGQQYLALAKELSVLASSNNLS